jgi:molecular chaperone DnaK (HSP70)
MEKLHTIGIDFGTSNSCVTYASYYERSPGEIDPDALNTPEVITFNQRSTLPTVLFLGNGADQQPLFGEPAEEKSLYYPELTRSGFKLQLGDSEHGADAYRLAVRFLRHLYERTAEMLPLAGGERGVRIETVVGHPVQWDADQRELTRCAATEAGFPNVRLEEESMGALYSYLCDQQMNFRPKPGTRILMVDMGGGTTDFAFVQLPMAEGRRPVSLPVDPAEVVPPWGRGKRTYGGRDLDQLILEYLTRDWSPGTVEKYRQSLLRQVRNFKEAFSDAVSRGQDFHESIWLVKDETYPVRLTREEFETLAGDYLAHFERLLRGALAEARLAPRQVNYLMLTGGHSRWYWVEEAVQRVCPHLSFQDRTILRHSNPEQTVACGLSFDPLIRSNRAGVLAPERKAAHAVWVSVPNGAVGSVLGCKAWEEPLLLIPRGQTLPYQTRAPLRIHVEQLGLSTDEANVSIRFFSGQKKLPLGERTARFERGTWEQLTKRLAGLLPWMQRTLSPDQFEVLVACRVDEHELITAEVLVTRYLGGKPAEVQRQQMRLNTGAGAA